MKICRETGGRSNAAYIRRLEVPQQGTLTLDATGASSLLCCCLSTALSLCQRSQEDIWSLNNKTVDRTTLKNCLRRKISTTKLAGETRRIILGNRNCIYQQRSEQISESEIKWFQFYPPSVKLFQGGRKVLPRSFGPELCRFHDFSIDWRRS